MATACGDARDPIVGEQQRRGKPLPGCAEKERD
jgi:hypothetical protein